MRALVVTNLYPPHHYGGYELLCRDTVEAWRARGHDVAVMCSDHRVAGRSVAGERDVERTLRFYWRDFEIVRPSPAARLATERSNRAHWTRALDRFQPDVVSVWNFGLFGFPLLAEVVERELPLVLVIGDLWPCWGPAFDPWTSMFAGSRPRHALGRLVERITAIATTLPDLGAHALALPASEWLRARIERESPFRFDRMAVVPHGFDPTDFPIIETGHVADRPFAWRLLLPGRIDERKGWRTAVQALADLPQASLTLAGGGADREIEAVRTAAAVAGVADRVRHLTVDRTGMAELYRNADVVLFPSEWDEPFGIVGLEAMACGTPLVATGTGGSAEYLEHESNCLLVPVGDSRSLATAVRRLADDGDLRHRLVVAGRATAGAHTADATIRDLERWHLTAITGAGS